MQSPTQQADAVVIGAGPAGCAAATVLARHGRDVVLLERERFPRYHIGESLIPYCWFALDRLGVVERVERSGCGVHKHSVQFASRDGHVSKPYYFFQHYDHPSARTWQVVRSEFDSILLENAREAGVRVLEQTAAEEIVQRDGAVVGVRAKRSDGAPLELAAPITIDASGRDGLAMKQLRWRVPDARLNKVAIWTYYEGALRDPGLDAGATTVAYLEDKGWFWYLPLAGDRVSVGVVAEPEYLFDEGRDLERVFLREVERQPWIREHLAPGRPTGEFRITREFSYRAQHCATDGLLLAGDAFAFLDPVFSSGVFLALHGGVLAGDAAQAALAAGDVSAARFVEYGCRVREALEAMRGLVHAFYDVGFNFGDFLRSNPDSRRDVTDVLIGNLHRDFSALFEAMDGFADLPPRLTHGGPRLER